LKIHQYQPKTPPKLIGVILQLGYLFMILSTLIRLILLAALTMITYLIALVSLLISKTFLEMNIREMEIQLDVVLIAKIALLYNVKNYVLLII